MWVAQLWLYLLHRDTEVSHGVLDGQGSSHGEHNSLPAMVDAHTVGRLEHLDGQIHGWHIGLLRTPTEQDYIKLSNVAIMMYTTHKANIEHVYMHLKYIDFQHWTIIEEK